MIKFELKNKETGKVESYLKEELVVAEVEAFHDLKEKINAEYEKTKPDERKVHKMERTYVVSLFSDQGLTEEDILNCMGIKKYNNLLQEILQEIFGEEEDGEEEGKTEEASQ